MSQPGVIALWSLPDPIIIALPNQNTAVVVFNVNQDYSTIVSVAVFIQWFWDKALTSLGGRVLITSEFDGCQKLLTSGGFWNSPAIGVTPASLTWAQLAALTDPSQGYYTQPKSGQHMIGQAAVEQAVADFMQANNTHDDEAATKGAFLSWLLDQGQAFANSLLDGLVTPAPYVRPTPAQEWPPYAKNDIANVGTCVQALRTLVTGRATAGGLIVLEHIEPPA